MQTSRRRLRKYKRGKRNTDSIDSISQRSTSYGRQFPHTATTTARATFDVTTGLRTNEGKVAMKGLFEELSVVGPFDRGFGFAAGFVFDESVPLCVVSREIPAEGGLRRNAPSRNLSVGRG